MTRAEIVAAARRWLGVPYAPHQRVPGVAIDCAGLPIMVAREVGAVAADFDINGYSLHPDGSLLHHCTGAGLRWVPRHDMADGDIVILKWGAGDAQHFGILATHPTYGVRSLIHAEAIRHKKVIEERLVFTAHTRFVAAFSFPGVT